MIPVAAGGWVVEAVLAPILTGVAVGLALRAVAIFGEIGSNSLKAGETRIDLMRWLRDRDRQFNAEVRDLLNSSGNQRYAGSSLNQLHYLMVGVLHEYRDRASSAVREYRSLAHAEGWLHGLLRRVSRRVPEPLAVGPEGHLILAGWRSTESPVAGDPDITVDPEDDPALAADAREIWPLEEEAGISWDAAGKRR